MVDDIFWTLASRVDLSSPESDTINVTSEEAERYRVEIDRIALVDPSIPILVDNVLGYPLFMGRRLEVVDGSSGG